MGTHFQPTVFGSKFAQIAWVVKDIQAAEKFFRDVLGISNFVKMENLQASQLEGSYYEKPGDFTFHLYMAYSGDSLLELIQPVSGRSVFQDFLDKHPEGGVQHVAYMVPVVNLDQAIAELTGKGYPVISTLNLPVAKVAFFDTYKEIGVLTELIGITGAGVEFVNQMKSGVN